MDYEIYHDESNIDGAWHGMLLVPVQNKQKLVAYLEKYRQLYKCKKDISLKDISKEERRGFKLARSWVLFGVGAIRTKTNIAKKSPYQIYSTTDSSKGKHEDLPELFGAKFILFRERDGYANMNGYPDHASKVETIIRMGTKGGLHMLGSDEMPIHVVSIHFDDHKHLQRHIDETRVVKRMQGLRDYITLALDVKIEDGSSSISKKEQSEADCNLLQLTDLMVGSFRVVLGESATPSAHHSISRPVERIIREYKKGYARMQNSRWCGGICMSQCFLEEDQWHFETFHDPAVDDQQSSLFDTRPLEESRSE